MLRGASEHKAAGNVLSLRKLSMLRGASERKAARTPMGLIEI